MWNWAKEETLEIQKSSIAILILNQSPLSMIFAIVRFLGGAKFVLSGDLHQTFCRILRLCPNHFWELLVPVMSNGYFSKTLHFLPALFSSAAEAPASSNFLTTSKCPPSVAMWSGVESVTLLREFNTTFKSCFINSSTTPSEPFAAAICAQVLPSWK